MRYVLLAFLFSSDFGLAAGLDPLQEALSAPNILKSREVLSKNIGEKPESGAWSYVFALVSLERLRGNESEALEWLKKCEQKCGAWPDTLESKAIQSWACERKKWVSTLCKK